MSFLKRDLYKYSRTTSDEDEPNPSHLENSGPGSAVIGYRAAACALLLAALMGALGFGVGQYALEVHRHPSREPPPANTIGFHSERRILRTFGHDRTFASAPSEETDRAWDSLFPEGRGFIEDETGHLEAVAVSVFHQLHCLDVLRHIYYAAESGMRVQPSDKESENLSRQHASHCLDYLRQALICAADSTIEPGNATTKHVTGFGVVHECRDFDGLVSWTEERRLIDEDTHNTGVS